MKMMLSQPMRSILISLFVVFWLGTVSAKNLQKTSPKVTVEINFGKLSPVKMVTVDCLEQLTALEVLQKAAIVETHPVGNYIFVTAIDDVKATRGEMAWYYRINGKEPEKLAMNQYVKAGDIISWRFVKDICSITVDGSKE